MCGIAGILAFGGERVSAERLHRMVGVLQHRGPDGEGAWISADGRVGFGHRRLAIIDLSPSGAQPMSFRSRFTITYNGEIYNYLELRRELEARGCRFVTASDTEVLLAAFAEYGERCLERLDGMFAFAIWDALEHRLFLARDRFGEKPLFYAHLAGRGFLFASEMKGLFAAGVPVDVNRRMLFKYLAYEVLEDPILRADTFYCGVYRLQAAHFMSVSTREPGPPRRYWSIPTEGAAPVPFEDACLHFRELLKDSVRKRLRSDVPVGTSLSGGLDSSTVVGLIRELPRTRDAPQATFSARFEDPRLDEGTFIEMVAQTADVDSHSTWPDESLLVDELPAIFYHHEEPIGSASGLAQWAVMRLAREQGVTVLLDGQGADELLGGYVHYFRPLLLGLYRRDRARFRVERAAYARVHGRAFPVDLRFRLEALAPGLLRRGGRLRRRLGLTRVAGDLHPAFVSAFGCEPTVLPIARDLQSALRFSLENYGLERLLRLADRSSMAFGREVRLPFLSHHLVEFVAALPESYKVGDGWTKRILRCAMAPVLPAPVAWRVDKIGFAAPQDRWMAHPRAAEGVRAAQDRLVRDQLLLHPTPAGAWRYLMAAHVLDFKIPA